MMEIQDFDNKGYFPELHRNKGRKTSTGL